jgi:hypothetical protein
VLDDDGRVGTQGANRLANAQTVLEAQDPDQGGSHRLRTGGQGDANGRAAVQSVEVGSGSQRHAVFVQQRLTPRLRVRVGTELITDAGVDVKGAIGRGNAGPAKIIDGLQNDRSGVSKGCDGGIGFSVGLFCERGDRRVLRGRWWSQREVSG